MADQYILTCTAGPTYSSQTPISPNTESKPIKISTSFADIQLHLRIQSYRGLPSSAPSTSPYFSHADHIHDLYSIQWTLIPKEPINSNDLVLGNDFDHPIRNRLPPGSDQALRIVKWFVDPGLEGDIYSDTPGLFGPVGSSVNILRVNDLQTSDHKPSSTHQSSSEHHSSSNPSNDEKEAQTKQDVGEVRVITEGGTSSGIKLREELKIPDTAAGRKKWFLTEKNRKSFTFEKDREYEFDFFNPYLDFNDFAIKLPGFSVIPGITIPVIKYWDGQPLRYVLKNKHTNETLFVVIVMLMPKDEAEGKHNDDGTVKTGQVQATKPAESIPETKPNTNDDDVD